MPNFSLRAMLLLLLIPATALATSVSIDQGKLRGLSQDGVTLFKGIPFAQPPVGNLRWAAPQAPEKWQGARDATEFGATCLQTERDKNSPYYSPLPQQSEDCLFLNVWTADVQPEESAPVMVWIHGGSFTRGSAASAPYEGTELAKKGVVLVTINYRLNIFGYLSHPQLTEEQNGTSGNYGLQDQIAALRWVKNNIAAFGGDPQRITIFGESAGSSSVNQIVVSPSAKGLFDKVIGQSGGFLSPQPSLDQAHTVGLALDKHLKASGIAEMRKKPAAKLLQAYIELEKSGHKFGPVIDGKVIPESPLALLKSGKFNRTPALLGYNRDEATYFAQNAVMGVPKTQHEFSSGLKQRVGPLAPAFLKAYPEDKGSRKPYLYFWRDMVFGWNMQTWSHLNTAAGQSTWMYFFTHTPATKWGEKLGAYHAAEIAYVFGNNVPDAQADREVQRLMSEYWVNFASRGDPNGKRLPAWPQYVKQENYLELNATTKIGKALDSQVMKVWDIAYNR